MLRDPFFNELRAYPQDTKAIFWSFAEGIMPTLSPPTLSVPSPSQSSQPTSC